ncbi:MAG: IS110 family transposase, partial [Chloroflexota bacterium]
MSTSRYFVGLDIAAETFTAAIGTTPWKLLVRATPFTNSQDGFQQLVQWLRQQDCTPEQTVLCMEATGVYGEALAYYLAAQTYPLAIEPPLKVKRAFKPNGPKTDAVDSEQIAEYACRFSDELRLWQPPTELVAQLQVLLATREQLVQQSTAHQNALHALRRKAVRIAFAEQVYEQMLAETKTRIKALEKEIQRLIDQHPTARRLLTVLLTIPGVGLLLAAHILVLTECATRSFPAPKLAAHLGIAPYEHQSGTSVYARPTSRHYGPPQPRKLLHLAARSVCTHNQHFRAYYERKVAEGKVKKLVLNNVANKLVRIICAILESQTEY